MNQFRKVLAVAAPHRQLTTEATAASPRERTSHQLAGRLTGFARPRPELVALLVLAGVLYLWSLSRNGFANDYYAAAVRSMAGSWHDFLYGSFDSSGVMTVDKPPLALWVQALSVRVFGFNSLALLIPQALMGVATVGLVYDMTRRHFGRVAGTVAGLALVLTPISVAISRHNNPDALLILCCVGAVWALIRAIEDGRTRWLVLSGLLVGLGFEAKMAVALMVVPGIVAAWLWIAPRGRLSALRQLLYGGVAMVVAGGAWPLLVALTPSADRPWISGTSDNSIWSLILGYNGLGRLAGQSGGPGGGMGGGPGGGGGGGVFGGSPSVTRLLGESLGGQAGWLLGFAVVGGIAVLFASRLRRADARTGWLIAVGGSFLACAVSFSAAKGIFHPYYVSLLAPFTALLIGAGFAELRNRTYAMRVLAPLAIAAGVATELAVLHSNPGQLGWASPLTVGVGICAGVAMWAFKGGRSRLVTLAIALAVLALAPAVWSVQTLGHATSGTFPAGGPASAIGGMGGGPGGPGGRSGRGRQRFAPPGAARGPLGQVRQGFGGPPPGVGRPGARGTGGGMFGGNAQLTPILRYIRAHGGGTVAVSSQSGAAGSIIQSGANVVALGGFSGRESEVSASWLAQRVGAGEVRYVLTDGSGAGPRRDARVGSSKLMAAVKKSCRVVPSSAYVTNSTSSSTAGGLYDCNGRAQALAGE